MKFVIVHKDYLENSFEFAKEHLDEFADGTLIVADRLGWARGRQNRRWSVEDGQLLLTLVLKPKNFSEQALRMLWMNLAVELSRAFEPTPVMLKWPNDLLLGGKKMGGLLMELLWRGTQVDAALVGIGINVNTLFASDHELYGIATSLRMHTSCEHDMAELLKKIVLHLEQAYQLWSEGTRDGIFSEWKKKQFFMNRIISSHGLQGELIEGKVFNFLENGDMILQSADGTLNVVPFYIASDVSVIY